MNPTLGSEPEVGVDVQRAGSAHVQRASHFSSKANEGLFKFFFQTGPHKMVN